MSPISRSPSSACCVACELLPQREGRLLHLFTHEAMADADDKESFQDSPGIKLLRAPSKPKEKLWILKAETAVVFGTLASLTGTSVTGAALNMSKSTTFHKLNYQIIPATSEPTKHIRETEFQQSYFIQFFVISMTGFAAS